jgi:hypothetical protein
LTVKASTPAILKAVGAWPQFFESFNALRLMTRRQHGTSRRTSLYLVIDPHRQRVAKDSVFLITEAEFIELNDPPQLSETQMRTVFGDIPATLNPPKITRERLDRLVRLAKGDAS